MKRSTIFLAITIFAMFIAGGCASPGEPATTAGTANAPHAECVVCKRNADLACIDVDVDGKTPSTIYNGKTYYFCSEDCRRDFQKNPAKYAGK